MPPWSRTVSPKPSSPSATSVEFHFPHGPPRFMEVISGFRINSTLSFTTSLAAAPREVSAILLANAVAYFKGRDKDRRQKELQPSLQLTLLQYLKFEWSGYLFFCADLSLSPLLVDFRADLVQSCITGHSNLRELIDL